jgi:hypothetical protein
MGALYMGGSCMDDPNMSIYHIRILTKVFIEFGGYTLLLQTFNHIYYLKIPYITTWGALYMGGSGMDDPNMFIYHIRILTKVFVEFGGCTLVLKTL